MNPLNKYDGGSQFTLAVAAWHRYGIAKVEFYDEGDNLLGSVTNRTMTTLDGSAARQVFAFSITHSGSTPMAVAYHFKAIPKLGNSDSVRDTRIDPPGAYTVLWHYGERPGRFLNGQSGVDDTSHGLSRTSPWRTLSYAMHNAPDGAVIYCDGGPFTIDSIASGFSLNNRPIIVTPDDGVDPDNCKVAFADEDGQIRTRRVIWLSMKYEINADTGGPGVFMGNPPTPGAMMWFDKCQITSDQSLPWDPPSLPQHAYTSWWSKSEYDQGVWATSCNIKDCRAKNNGPTHCIGCHVDSVGDDCFLDMVLVLGCDAKNVQGIGEGHVDFWQAQTADNQRVPPGEWNAIIQDCTGLRINGQGVFSDWGQSGNGHGSNVAVVNCIIRPVDDSDPSPSQFGKASVQSKTCNHIVVMNCSFVSQNFFFVKATAQGIFSTFSNCVFAYSACKILDTDDSQDCTVVKADAFAYSPTNPDSWTPDVTTGGGITQRFVSPSTDDYAAKPLGPLTGRGISMEPYAPFDLLGHVRTSSSAIGALNEHS